MMKFKPSFLISAGFMSLMVGCGSMEVDSPVISQEGLVPSDFNYQAFVAVNPDMEFAQAAGAVVSRNRIWEDSLKTADTTITSTIIKGIKTVEDSLFLMDTAVVRFVYTRSFNKALPGALTTAEMTQLKKFNLYGRTDDVSFINTFLATGVDTLLVLQSYTLYGIPEGRPYRACLPTDVLNTPKSITLENVVQTLPNGSTKVDYSGYRFCSQTQIDGTTISYVVPQE